jgi:hypothetical protein
MLRERSEDALRATPLWPYASSPIDEAGLWRFVEEFRDSAGNRRPADRPFLMHMLGLRSTVWPATDWRERHPEAALWSCQVGDPEDDLPRGEFHPGGSGPYFPFLHDRAIEMWTEAELCGLHAATWIARHVMQHMSEHIDLVGAKVPLWRPVRVAEWLIAEVQPDNATNHPWAVHCFAWMSTLEGRSELQRDDARMYAETLLHNAMVVGSLDTFSACILWDSAAWLDGCGSAKLSPL